MTELLARNANYLMALLDQALGCDATLDTIVDGTADCTCDLTGRHFFHHCPQCDITWIKA